MDGRLNDLFTNDESIAGKWCEMNRNRSEVSLGTNKGVQLAIRTNIIENRRVEYRAFLPDVLENGKPKEIAWMYTGVVNAGRVKVTNGGVDRDLPESDESQYRRRGIARAVYDLIESDIKSAGGRGIEPDWGNMSNDAVDFWKDRRPDLAEKLEQHGRLGSEPLSFREEKEL